MRLMGFARAQPILRTTNWMAFSEIRPSSWGARSCARLEGSGWGRRCRKRPPGFPGGLSCLTVAPHWRAISEHLHRGPISRPHSDRQPLQIGTVANWSPNRRDGLPSP